MALAGGARSDCGEARPARVAEVASVVTFANVHVAKGTVIAGKYRLDEPLAAGGMGSVWRARHLDLDVDVAIKLIALTLASDPTSLARFKREARSAAQLRSSHVVQILDYGVFEGTPYIAMELLQGEDLDAAIERDGPLSVGRVKGIALDVGKALRHAHDAGIVHRDLKPANIFLAKHGGDETVKLLDFGIAKESQLAMGAAVTTGGSALLGSPLYMSPEQIAGEKVDHRTDLWSLAVVMFEALTGSPPFDAKGIGELFLKISTGATPLPSDHGIAAPGLDEFFRRAFQRDREKRFQSVRELLGAFDAIPEVERPKKLVSSPKLLDGEAETAAALPAVSVRGREGDTLDLAASAPHTADRRVERPRWIAPAVIAAALAGAVGLYAVLSHDKPSGAVASGDDASEAPAPSQSPARTTVSAGLEAPRPTRIDTTSSVAAPGSAANKPSATAVASAPLASRPLPARSAIAAPPIAPTVVIDTDFGIPGTKKP
jgi:serine/threonine protein kinase